MKKQITDSERLDWIQAVMYDDTNYTEIYLAGLRDFKAGHAKAYQIESNPWEKFNSLQAPNVREAIDRAMEKYPCASINTTPEPKGDKVDALTLQEKSVEDILRKHYEQEDGEPYTDEDWEIQMQEHATIAGLRAVEEYGRLKWNQACEEQKSQCSFNLGIHSDVLVYPADFPKMHERIMNAPKPEFKP